MTTFDATAYAQVWSGSTSGVLPAASPRHGGLRRAPVSLLRLRGGVCPPTAGPRLDAPMTPLVQVQFALFGGGLERLTAIDVRDTKEHPGSIVWGPPV
jgi:hypothetical protein